MRLGNRPERDPREAALADVYRGSMSDQPDPRRAALADLSDPAGEPEPPEQDKGSKRGLEWTGSPETLRLLQQEPHAEQPLRFEGRMRSVNDQQHQGLAVDRYANFERDTRDLPEHEVDAVRSRLFGEMLDEAMAKGVGIEGARVAPLPRGEESIESLERARRNRALVGR